MEKLGPYGLLEKLCDEAFGSLYRACDSSRSRYFTIRTFHTDLMTDSRTQARFSSEFEALAVLKHPNLATVYDHGREGTTAYIVMEWLSGKDLQALIAEKTAMQVEDKLAIVGQAAAGLGCAHEHGILHGSLTTRSILITPDGRVKVWDLQPGGPVTPPRGFSGDLAQCLSRLAPESSPADEATPQSDLFALGMICYEFMTGAHPFLQDGSGSCAAGEAKPRFLTVEKFPELPLGLWPIVERCLAEDAGDRFVSMAEFEKACLALLAELAEDSQLMRIELQTALPRIRQAAGRSGAAPSLLALKRNVESALARQERPDYQRLNGLVANLAEHYHLLQDTCETARSLSEVSIEIPKEEGQPPENESSGSKPEAPPSQRVGDQQTSADPEAPSPDQARIQKTLEHFLASWQAQDDPGSRVREESLPAVESLPPAPPPLAAEPMEPPEPAPTPACAAVNTSDQAPELREDTDIPTGSQPSSMAEAVPEEVSEVRPDWNRWRTPAWMGASMLLLVLALAIPVWITSRAGWDPVRRVLNRNSAAARMSAPSAPNASGDANTEAVQADRDSMRRELLLEEAQALRAAGRLHESRVFLDRILDLSPEYAPALDEIELLKVAGGTDGSRLEDTSAPEPEVQKLLASASSAIRSGNLQKAKADLDKVERLQPGLAEAGAMRRRLADKGAELSQSLTLELEKQQDALRIQKTIETVTRQSDELYRQGKYDEVLALLATPGSPVRQSPQGTELRDRTMELQSSLKALEEAIASKKFTDASVLLEKVQKLNPADPNLSILRRRIDAVAVSGSVVLSVYPLGDAGTLMIDNQTVGVGEILNHKVPAGRHKLTALSQSGQEVALNADFADGQKVFLVYDATRQILRTMVESDRQLMARNKAKAEVHRFSVEHPHGILRGSCRGELLVGYHDVMYRPEDGSHGFSIPFKNLALRIEDRTVVLVFAVDGGEMMRLRVQDAQIGKALRSLWDDLVVLDK